ncbi:PQQ-binding-like beta-propeller repeat protein [Streptomyces sp. NPDC028635]|uniref:protein kinase domain-containing protein n=1 Tax=Streptomyces sp. NPDC028635 TaxID=3154800 RepID=UPI0033FC86C2
MPLRKDDPRSVGGYRIVDRLGAGGMGVVYRGRSRSGREVAVKVVHAQYAADGVFRARFRQEIAAVRRVSGAFTAPVVDADPEAARPWMATQYVPGPSLALLIRTQGAIVGPALRSLALGLVEALRDIHRAGVVHRDLKPGNVLMADDGPRVIDFGISRAAGDQTLTETGHLMGTPPFMSPEQLTDARSVGPASDVFSLGALLVFAVTGRGPFDTDSPYLTAYRVLHEEPELGAVPRPLRDLLARCLAKEPADRPALDVLAREFAALLPEETPDDRLTMDLGRAPAPEAAGERPRRRGRAPAMTAATVGTVGLALTAYLLWGGAGGTERTAARSSATASPAARWGAVPQGWHPWRTTLHDPATGGEDGSRMLSGGMTDAASCRASGGDLYCGGSAVRPKRIDGRTGAIRWRAALPRGLPLNRYESHVLGVRDGVVVAVQTVSSVSQSPTVTEVVALDTRTGRQVWSRVVTADDVGPAMSAGLVLTPEGDGRTVTARSPRDGSKRWTLTLPVSEHCTLRDVEGRPYAQCGSYGSGSADGQLVVVDPSDGSARRLRAPSGRTILMGTVSGRLLLAQYEEDVTAGPTADVSWTRFVLLDPVTGARTSVKAAEEYRGGLTLADGRLYVAGSAGRVTAVSPGTGRRLWQTTTTLQQPGNALADERTGTVYLAGGNGRVAALDGRSGALLWESSAQADRVDGDSWTKPGAVTNDGTLVVDTPDGTVFSLDPAHPDRRPAAG